MTRWGHPTHPMQLVWGLLLWSLWFVVLYGVQALHCVLAPVRAARQPTELNIALLLAAAVLTGCMIWLMSRCLKACGQPGLPPTARFIALAGTVLHGTAAFSTLFVALPLWRLPPCL